MVPTTSVLSAMTGSVRFGAAPPLAVAGGAGAVESSEDTTFYVLSTA
jgi:hypothetical protein